MRSTQQRTKQGLHRENFMDVALFGFLDLNPEVLGDDFNDTTHTTGLLTRAARNSLFLRPC